MFGTQPFFDVLDAGGGAPESKEETVESLQAKKVNLEKALHESRQNEQGMRQQVDASKEALAGLTQLEAHFQAFRSNPSLETMSALTGADTDDLRVKLGVGKEVKLGEDLGEVESPVLQKKIQDLDSKYNALARKQEQAIAKAEKELSQRQKADMERFGREQSARIKEVFKDDPLELHDTIFPKYLLDLKVHGPEKAMELMEGRVKKIYAHAQKKQVKKTEEVAGKPGQEEAPPKKPEEVKKLTKKDLQKQFAKNYFASEDERIRKKIGTEA